MSRLQDSVDAVSCVLDQPFEESDALLAKPGFNSSRWVTTELRQLQVNDLNVDRVLRKKLATSSRLRNEIMEKVCTSELSASTFTFLIIEQVNDNTGGLSWTSNIQ